MRVLWTFTLRLYKTNWESQSAEEGMKKTFTNDTEIPQVYYDQGMNAYTLQPGESMELDIGGEYGGGSPSPDSVVQSDPPTGMQQVKNVYRDPKTGKMAVIFDDNELP